ncbi:DISARM system phospholipase D-like protein DrmC [Frankia umida]|uniref:DISARM system phospholipase D-like protein DrmC n=1 Tax=Frankia umida TaxID=573489 RepID=UPI00200D0336|nr:DISARM system phospholipase D-like protein DrmC [Frankia umida]
MTHGSDAGPGAGQGGFVAAVAAAVRELGPTRLGQLADRIDPPAGQVREGTDPTAPSGSSGQDAATVAAVAGASARQAVQAVLAARRAERIAPVPAAVYLRGVAAGYGLRAQESQVEAVWSGPGSHTVPVRATARVLMELVTEATTELMLMTYAARPYPPLLTALDTAIARGVAVSVVVETLQGAGSGLAGSEPAAAFAQVRGIDLWHWPTARRPRPGARMHAKIAVADRRLLLVSSANLTLTGVEDSIEAGLLVRGGIPPRRAAEHVHALRASGELARLAVSPGPPPTSTRQRETPP